MVSERQDHSWFYTSLHMDAGTEGEDTARLQNATVYRGLVGWVFTVVQGLYSGELKIVLSDL